MWCWESEPSSKCLCNKHFTDHATPPPALQGTLKQRFVYFYLLCVFYLHVHMCTMCVFCVQRVQKRVLEPLELELPIVVRYHVVLGTYLGSLQEHPVC